MSGVPGMPLPGWALAPCGTLAAYRRHYRRGERIDEACRQASIRAWEDRPAGGWTRPSRAVRVHLAARDGAAACSRAGVAVTDDPDRVTCLNCRAGFRRVSRTFGDREASRAA